MNDENNKINILSQKLDTSIEEHLKRALLSKSVKASYQARFMDKRINEPSDHYVERMLYDSFTYQFVRVIHGRTTNYVAFGVEGPIITKQGRFILISAEIVGGKWGKHYLLIHPDLSELKKSNEVMIRIDSGCNSGQVFEDITCDCKAQLVIAQEMCIKNGSGIIVHIPQHDGRGWGEFKMANQKIMDELGCDTVEAARLFYGDESVYDQRTYDEVLIILMALGLDQSKKYNLATNNPRKIGAFEAVGFKVSNPQKIVAENLDEIARRNLEAKCKHWEHDIGLKKDISSNRKDSNDSSSYSSLKKEKGDIRRAQNSER